MGRPLNKLTEVKIRATSKKGRHSDGGGLYLNVSASGGKSWVFMWTPPGGTRREMGLGPYPVMSLSKARTAAAKYRTDIADGRDPLIERNRTPTPTFLEAGRELLATIRSEWSNAKHEEQWTHTVEVRCAGLHKLQVSEIATDHILKVLRQPVEIKYRGVLKSGEFWLIMPETAGRVRNRIERILDFCRSKGWRSGENPARWKGHLSHLLPKPAKLVRGHQPAMPYEDVPAFMRKLREQDSLAARAAEFTILTMSRSNEVLGARWSEVDFGSKIWTVPAHRMKMGKEHTVPLSERALEILTQLDADPSKSKFVFPGRPRIANGDERPLSNMSMLMLVRRLGHNITMHGFRSSARDWAGDETSFPREVIEHALAHKVGDSVEVAYRRSTALGKRRDLMNTWASYCCPPEGRNVIAFHSATAETAK